ncbi:MAG: nitroreductase family protein [Candidatus Cryosericum sp.]
MDSSRMNYISLIRERHSVRAYEPHALTERDREEVAGAIASAVPLQSGRLLHWALAERSVMGCSALLYAQCDPSEEQLSEYGYQGEQIVLALLANGWGTCWYASVRLPGSPCSIAVGRPSRQGPRAAITAMMARGYTRKPLEKLMTNPIPEDCSPMVLTVLNSARLAPSAVNRQPWTFQVVSGSEVVISTDNERFLDLGICAAHAMVTARQLAGEVTIRRLSAGHLSVSW